MNKETRKALALIFAAAVFLAGAIIVANSIKGPSPESVQNSQLELRDRLVWSCEYVGNPLREVVQSMIREEIRSSAHVKPSYFPDIPPKVFRHLLKVQIAAKRHRLKRAAPIDCNGLFPPP
jgi:hypothetical protein